MPRKHRPLDRASGAPRDTSIIVIACEDTHAVKQYFSKFRTRRVQYKVLPTTDCDSSPRAVIDRLNAYRSEYATEEHDELWICIDADHRFAVYINESFHKYFKNVVAKVMELQLAILALRSGCLCILWRSTTGCCLS